MKTVKRQSKRPVPFQFVLEYLAAKDPIVRPMFGCFAVYVGGKIALVLRDRKDHPRDNGVWIATTHDHHKTLRKVFPSMRSIGVLGKPETGWQVLPSSDDDFEQAVIKACELVLREDPRIGKIPAERKRRSSANRTVR